MKRFHRHWYEPIRYNLCFLCVDNNLAAQQYIFGQYAPFVKHICFRFVFSKRKNLID